MSSGYSHAAIVVVWCLVGGCDRSDGGPTVEPDAGQPRTDAGKGDAGEADAAEADGGHDRVDLFAEALARTSITEPCEVEADDDGFVSAGEMRDRALAYLRAATEDDGTSTGHVIAHVLRERLDEGYDAPTDLVPTDAWDESLDAIEALQDTSDFRVLELLGVLYTTDGHPILAPDLVDRVDQALLGFKYWFVDPTPSGRRDDMWYWTENHLCSFHAAEYLAGQRFASATFEATGWTGAQHQQRARTLLLEWFDTVRRFGFKEFHSDVYYDVQLRPLLLLAEFAEEEDIATLAAMTLDLMFFDMALHTREGTFGATRGRTYKKDKLRTLDENTFPVIRFLFDNTELDENRLHANVLRLAGATRYRLPQVIADVADDLGPFVDRERMSIPVDESGPLVDEPVAPYGLSFADPDAVSLWWSLGLQTAWQVVPLTLQTMDAYNLWENESFAPFRPLMPLVANIPFARQLAHDNASLLNFAALTEVNSYTYRTADYMLSSAQDRRFGARSEQGHPWQATLGDDAFVFVTHPGVPPIESDSFGEDPDVGQWTGTASLPRSAQYGNVGIYLQSPKYGPGDPPLLEGLGGYEPYTHAFFPQERFDEVVHQTLPDQSDEDEPQGPQGSWTFARLGEGYLALYSYRPAEFVQQPDGVPTGGFQQPFELRADGGPDNVWIIEMGSRIESGSFERFREAILDATVAVEQREDAAEATPPETGQIPAFFERVVYDSPSRGRITFGHDAPLRVSGEDIPLSAYPRYDNPYSHTAFEQTLYQITRGCDEKGVQLDFSGPTRTVW